jgi:hypothetical protein
MKVGVIGGFRSVTHSVSWAVWACACYPLISCMAYASLPILLPPILSFPRKGGRDIRGEGILEGPGTHGTPGRTE